MSLLNRQITFIFALSLIATSTANDYHSFDTALGEEIPVNLGDTPEILVYSMDFDAHHQHLLYGNSTVAHTMFGPGGVVHSRSKRNSYMPRSVYRRMIAPRALVSGTCGKPKIPEFTKNDTNFPGCIRKYAYYSIGGRLMQPDFEELSGCFIEDNIDSCNLGGKHYVVQQPHNNSFTFHSCDFHDGANFTKRGRIKNSPLALNIPNSEENYIYETYLYGSEKIAAKNGKVCGMRSVHFCDDGVYELYVRVADYKQKNDKHDRKFSIKMNDVYLFKDVGIFQRQKNITSAVQLIVIFQIKNSKIYLDKVAKPIQLSENGTVDLKFCYADCKKAKRRGFIVSAYTVHKIIPGPELDLCEKYTKTCRCLTKPECDYIVSSGECRNRTLACRIPCNKRRECYRKDEHVFYMRGGAVCQYPKGYSKYCDKWGKVQAVNFGDSLTDYRDIQFDSHVGIAYDDPEKASRVEKIMDASWKGVPAGPTTTLYEEFLSGRNTNCSNCIKGSGQKVAFHAHLPGPGKYEFSLMTIEDRECYQNIRDFSFRVDDFELALGIDSLKYRPNKHGIEYNFLFQVVGKSDGTYWLKGDNYCGTYARIDGYYKSSNCTKKEVKDMTRFPISFHFGKCNPHKFFVVSSYSLISFGNNSLCVSRPSSEFDKSDIIYPKCVHKDAFYSINGEARKPKFEDLSGCTIEDNIDSRNINGSFIDIKRDNGFTINVGLFSDQNGIVRTLVLNNVQGIRHPEEKLIYATASYATDEFENPSSDVCAHRTIRFCDDGFYELNIRTVDPDSIKVGQRKFNVKLGREYLFQEVDIFELVGKPNTAVELIALFEIKDNSLFLKVGSNESITLSDGSVDLMFCYSNCVNMRSRSFIVSGYTVHKLGPPPGPDPCEKLNKAPCICTQTTDCEYLPALEQCRSRDRICKRSCNSNNTNCYRKGDHVYYLNGGAICSYPQGKPSYCNVFEEVIAVNFGSSDIVDYRNITFISHSRTGVEEFEDPDRVFHLGNATIIDIPEGSTQELYSEYLWGYSHTFAGKQKPIKYFAKLPGAGSYELSILLGESFICEAGVRDFAFQLNDVVLVRGFDVLRYRKINQGMEVNLLFDVFTKKADGTFWLKADGYCTKASHNGVLMDDKCIETKIESIDKVSVSFHFGECFYSRSFPIAGFSIVKLMKDQDLPECSYEIKGFGRSVLKNSICVRSHAFYSIEELPHKPTFEELGNCYVEDNLGSCDFGGGMQIESGSASDRNLYTFDPCHLQDPEDIVLNGNTIKDKSLLRNLYEVNTALYDRYIRSDSEYANPDSSICAYKPIKFCDNGVYELSIRAFNKDVFSSFGLEQTRFNIKLGDKLLFKEVDPFQLADTDNTAIHLIAILEKDGDSLLIDGSQNNVYLDEKGAVDLKFCYSGCDKNPNKDFLLFGYAIHKLTPGPEVDRCTQWNGKPCDCTNHPDCDYTNENEQCRNRTQYCRLPCRDRDLEDNCFRKGPHVHYIKGGALCQYSHGDEFYCQQFDEILAVNFGESLVDYRSINFSSHKDVDQFNHPEPNLVTVQPGSDLPDDATKKMYSSCIEGNLKSAPFNFTAVLPSSPGHYELSFMMHEGLKEPNQGDRSDFVVQIANFAVTKSLDIKRFRGKTSGIEINVPFDLRFENGSFYIWPYGHSVTRRIDGFDKQIKGEYVLIKDLRSVPISLSVGECNSEPRPLICGFLILKFRKLGETPVDKCTLHPNVCKCSTDTECDFLISSKECMNRAKVCKTFEQYQAANCYRKGDHVYYLLGGAVCHFETGSDNYCRQWENVFAVNYGGDEVTDYRGIQFRADPGPKQTAAPENPEVKISVEGVPEGGTRKIYETVRTPKWKKGVSSNPVNLTIILPGAGNYELSIMFLDSLRADVGVRGFSFFLNDIELVREFDINKYRARPKGLEINILFQVAAHENGYVIFVHGQCYLNDGLYTENSEECQSNVISDSNKLELRLKHGECHDDPSFMISGLSLIRFKESNVIVL